MKKKIIIITIVIVIIGALVGVYFGYVKPLVEAKKAYNDIVSTINDKNNKLDNSIDNLQKLVNSGEKPLDESLTESSKEIIKEAQADKYVIEKIPSGRKNIEQATEKLKNENIDYSDITNKLDNQTNNLSKSIESYKKFINPTQDYVISKLATIDEVGSIMPATEDNDPNNQLNKEKGYTCDIYFESKNVDRSKIYDSEGKDILTIGTDGGGSIEVYKTEEDAIKRRDYLAGYDGGIFASGTHRVVGTTLIRTSHKLNATQQKELEQKIIDALAN